MCLPMGRGVSFFWGECFTASFILRLHVTTWYKGTYERKMRQWGLLNQIPFSLNMPPCGRELLSKQQPAASSFSIFPTINSRPAWGHVLPGTQHLCLGQGGNKTYPILMTWLPLIGDLSQRASGYKGIFVPTSMPLSPNALILISHLSPWTSCQNLLLENLTCEK